MRDRRDRPLGASPGAVTEEASANLSRGLLSTWIITGLFALGAAWVLDESFGGIGRASSTVPARDAALTSLDYLARIGVPPVMATLGLLTGVALIAARRRTAGGAVLTASLVVIAFSARIFAIVDFIGWRQATAQALTGGRTVATTAIAIVVSMVLFREGLIDKRGAIFIGVLFPLAVGFSRLALGVYPAPVVAGQWFIGALIGLVMVVAYRIVIGQASTAVDA